jgi:hypothetical protein
MPRLTKGTTFQSGDTVTADSLNELIDNAEFVAGSDGATDNTTLAVHSDGYLEVKDGGVGLGKLANLSSKSVIGNNSSSTATPTAVPINDLLSDMNNATAHTGGTADSDGLNTTGGTDGLLSAYDKTKLNSIEVGAEVNPSNATTSASGLMSSTDKQKLNGIATNANNYSHPTGDGNLHVPATGTGNVGKVLTAGSSAGSISWQSASGPTVSSSMLFSGQNLSNVGNWTQTNNLIYGWKTSEFNNVTITNGIGGGNTYPSMWDTSSVYKHVNGKITTIGGTLEFKLNLNPNANDPTIWHTQAGSVSNTSARNNITLCLEVRGNISGGSWPNYTFTQLPNDLIPLAGQFGTSNLWVVGRHPNVATSTIYSNCHLAGSTMVSNSGRINATTGLTSGNTERLYIYLNIPDGFANHYFKEIAFCVSFFNSIP